MKIIRGFPRRRWRRPTVATLGMFDGVHQGHQMILKRMVKEAASRRMEAVVVTFREHPLRLLAPAKAPAQLISLEHRLGLLSLFGVDAVVVLPFTRRISRMSPENFAQRLFVQGLNARQIFIGPDFRFGHRRQGNPELLVRIGRRYGFSVRVVRPYPSARSRISSTAIRHLVESGQMSRADRLLGHPFCVWGTVVPGSRRGGRIGIPTANLDPHHEALPPQGVWVVRTESEGRWYGGVANLGTRPTFERNGGFHHYSRPPVLELHLFGFHRNIYGRTVKVRFLKRLRDERRFDSAANLRDQVEKDVIQAKRILSRSHPKVLSELAFR